MPPGEKTRLKKGHQKFWEIDEISWGNADIFLETPKKGPSKIWPPVSEGLDPLLQASDRIQQPATFYTVRIIGVDFGGTARARAPNNFETLMHFLPPFPIILLFSHPIFRSTILSSILSSSFSNLKTYLLCRG